LRRNKKLDLTGPSTEHIFTYVHLINIHGGMTMLILSRKERERIRLGDSIVLTVVQVSGDRVRIGVEAPSNVLILREELEPFAADQSGSKPSVRAN
jgi:carbon storage regulator